MKLLASIIALLILVPSTYAQGCYGGAYGQYQAQPVALATNFCTATQLQTVTQTVQVPVTISVPVQTVAVQQVAVAPVCQAVSLQSACPVGLANYGSVGISHYGSVGLGYGNVGFANRSAFVGGNRFAFNNGLAIGGTGVSIAAQDRRGTQVVASGINNVRIQRGLLGRINGASADTRGGLLSRFGL